LKIVHYGITALCAFLLVGCAGGKVRALEDKFAEEQARRAALQTQKDFLQTNLTYANATIDSLEGELRRKDEVIRQFALMLDSMQSGVDQTGSFEAGPKNGGSEPTGAESQTEGFASPESDQQPETEVNAPEASQEPPPVEKSTEIGDYKAEYDRALDLFRQKKVAEAEELFRTLLESDRTHKLAGNCQFWIGECLYSKRQYEAALAEYEKVFAFPKSYKTDAAQYKIGLSYLILKKYPEARDGFNRLISAYPSSEYVERARTQLDQIP
jgi:TolA-binding protein